MTDGPEQPLDQLLADYFSTTEAQRSEGRKAQAEELFGMALAKIAPGATAPPFDALRNWVDDHCPPDAATTALDLLRTVAWKLSKQRTGDAEWLAWVLPSVRTDTTSIALTPSESLQRAVLAWSLEYAKAIDGICQQADVAIPFTPVLRAWLDSQPVDPERRPDKIAPSAFRAARPTQAKMDIKAPPLGPQPAPVPTHLPGFEPPLGAVIPVLPLTVAQEGTAGKSAAITPRLWWGAQMALPIDLRTGGNVPLRFTLQEIVDWLWPNGWARSRHLAMLHDGMRNLYRMGVEYDRREWLLVRPVALPTSATQLRDELIIEVTALPNSGNGPMVNTQKLWQLGTRGDPPWRAWIRLAYLWDEVKRSNGGFRVYSTQPAVKRGPGGVILNARDQPVMSSRDHPVTNWSDKRAIRTGGVVRHPQADRVPVLDTRDLAHLGYDDSPRVAADTIRNRARKTREWLRRMEADGYVALEWDGDNIRVLELWSGYDSDPVNCAQ